MRGARQLGILAVVTFSAALLGGPASADEIPEESALVGIETESITSKETTVDSPDTSVPVVNKCKTTTRVGKGVNVYGNTLFKFHQKVSWCYNGKKITSVSSKAWADSTALLWTYKGIESEEISGGKGKTSYTAWRQGRFCYVTHLSCIKESLPWIEQKVTATGGVTNSNGW
ncbi:hypothetical protein [Nonomuraea dietziae]|uniref:hypothetical protein n=1 Tax=Nonomuraea dietziae TaxID=65515 RepID=UPI0033D2AADB